MECLKPDQQERLQKVEAWLKSVLKSVPVFEVNEETLDILEQYMTYYDGEESVKEGDSATIQEEMKHFQTESVRLASLLGSLNLDPDKDLESEAAIFTKALHKASVKLNVSKPTLPCCMSAIASLQEQYYQVESELDTATDQVEELKSVRNHLEAMKRYIEKMFENLESCLQEEKKNYEKSSKTAKDYMAKGVQYNQKISLQTAELKGNKFSESIRHEEITNLSCELATLENQLAPLKLKLQSYQDLPLDEELARRKLIEKKAELNGILARLKLIFNDISLGGKKHTSPAPQRSKQAKPSPNRVRFALAPAVSSDDSLNCDD